MSARVIEFTGKRPTLREIAKMHGLTPPDDRHALLIELPHGIRIVFPDATAPQSLPQCQSRDAAPCTDPGCNECWRQRTFRSPPA